MHYDDEIMYSRPNYKNLICKNCVFKKEDLVISGTIFDGASNSNCRIYTDGKPSDVFTNNKCTRFIKRNVKRGNSK